MIGLLQRVGHAEVRVDDRVVAAIGRGLLVFVGIEREDETVQADRLCERILNYRVFPDERGRMNLSVADVGGEVLLVPQFTIAADTRSGTRASFTRAAEPAKGQRLFDELVQGVRERNVPVQSGLFGADMQVALLNDGPVTFWLEAPPDRTQSV